MPYRSRLFTHQSAKILITPCLQALSRAKTVDFSLRVPKVFPKTVTHDQAVQLIAACTNERDRFLVSLLHETGLRIGQALALRHEDIKSWDNEIHVLFRKDNINQARNKSLRPNIIHVSMELMQLYSTYLLSERSYPDNEYVFVNYKTGTPLHYSAVKPKKSSWVS